MRLPEIQLRKPALVGILLFAGVYSQAVETLFPEKNTAARIPTDPLDEKIVPSNPSPYGIMTSQRWSYGAPYRRETLSAVENPNPNPEPQPVRAHPADVELSSDGSKVYVALQGSEIKPGSTIAVLDLKTGEVSRRLDLRGADKKGGPGTSPYRIISHPDGRHLIVINQFSNFASTIDTVKEEIVNEIPLDFYCQDGVYSQDGKQLFLANRYLDQVFLLESEMTEDSLRTEMKIFGGIDDSAFLGDERESNLHSVLQRSCGATGCHDEKRGEFYAGEDPEQCLLSALEHVVPGRPEESRLLGATIAMRDGGYADMIPKFQSHAMGVVVFPYPESNENYRRIREWIEQGGPGPGIPIGNPRSKPAGCALTSDERYLFVGNTGTQDISIVDTRLRKEVGGIFIQNGVNDLLMYRAPDTGKDYLIVSTLGIGFGVTKERDPFAGESWDTDNPAAQFSVWRNPETGRPLPRKEQEILGPFDITDGTLEIKFRDIQNDLLFIDVGALDIPEEPSGNELEYLLKANRYEAHKDWVRYTSDTAESTYGDIKGDIPPALMRVIGAFPDRLSISGDRLFVTMQGSNLVQEWKINPSAGDPIDYLVPLRTFDTGMQPKGIAAGKEGSLSENKLVVANFLGGSVSVIDRETGSSTEYHVDPSAIRIPVPATNAERGEIMAHTSFYSSDGDTSCLHCHARDMGDGRSWGVSQVLGQEFLSPEAEKGAIMIGGSMNVPQMRGLFGIQPFFFEGVISGYEPRSMMLEHCPSDDFREPIPNGDFSSIYSHYTMSGQDDIQSKMDTSTNYEADMEERRDEMFRVLSRKQFGKSFNLRDFQRFIGEWQVHEPRLLPNPFDPRHPSIRRGKLIFEDPQVGCVSCHPAPHFAKKDFPDNPNQAIPPVVTFTVRDGSFTLLGKNREDFNNEHRRDLEPWDQGRFETNQGHLTTFPLRGVWDRPAMFLHNGLARNLMEVAATPEHPALRHYRYEPLAGGYPERPGSKEVGMNVTFLYATAEDRVKMHRIAGARMGIDTHGGTSHLTRQEMEDLVNFMNSIE